MHTEKIWTSQGLLRWTTGYFEKQEIDHPRLSAEMLLAHVLGCERLKLYMDPERPASELERAAFRDLVERAIKHEPVDYLVGEAPFFSMMFEVNKDVLVPRPSTETLVEHVIQHARVTPGFGGHVTIADVCTGSGVIAICLAKQLKDAKVIATDVSVAAIAVAKRNAVRYAVADRIEFRVGDLLEPLVGERVKYLVSNPPYIPDDEWKKLETNVKAHEPELALRGGVDGMDLLRVLVDEGRGLIESPGQIVLEMAAVHDEPMRELLHKTDGYEDVKVLPDHEGYPRILVADKR
ncbi:peptide chain release factor N(5)-glutamine methyltransferase [Poriferisphaera sp. WC338]|uniref:peptide chain release factor N(5)-glutamine methyltransferase n=1 Tax=Poriferisphaera sp. WC338 TaxID=3425129 RepID=UPI003D81722A